MYEMKIQVEHGGGSTAGYLVYTDAGGFVASTAARCEEFAADLRRRYNVHTTLLYALQEVVASAITDADTCPICEQDITEHFSGCSVLAAEHAIALAEGKE